MRHSDLQAQARTAEARLADAQASAVELTAQLQAGCGGGGGRRDGARRGGFGARAAASGRRRNCGPGPTRSASRWSGTFAELSAEALQKNNEQFLALAETKLSQAQTAAQGDLNQRQQAIAQLLRPLSETLARYERGLQQIEVERKGAYEGLSEKVAQLHLGHEQLQKETRNLVTALRSPQTRGRWGEIQLRRVVEMAGMVAHCDFDEQVSTNSDDGRLRPDMIVHVPGGGEIVVDAKVPLEAFLKLIDADDDASRALFQASHARQLRTHVDQLAKKEYWKQFAQSPQQVVAFIPGDQLLSAAYESDPTLQEHAMANGVLLTTPTMLIALLRTVAFGWRQESLAENAREVQKLGAELYERLRTMSAHMQKLQRSLTASVVGLQRRRGIPRVPRPRLGPALSRARCGGHRDRGHRRSATRRGLAAPAPGHRAGGGRRQSSHRTASPRARASRADRAALRFGRAGRVGHSASQPPAAP